MREATPNIIIIGEQYSFIEDEISCFDTSNWERRNGWNKAIKTFYYNKNQNKRNLYENLYYF